MKRRREQGVDKKRGKERGGVRRGRVVQRRQSGGEGAFRGGDGGVQEGWSDAGGRRERQGHMKRYGKRQRESGERHRGREG